MIRSAMELADRWRARFQRSLGRTALSMAVHYAPSDVAVFAVAAAQHAGFKLFRDGQEWVLKPDLTVVVDDCAVIRQFASRTIQGPRQPH